MALASQDAVYGPTVEVFLHEISHALFDMLKVPILGREEDAADLLAAYTMLNMDKDLARKSVSGVAYVPGREARAQNVKLEQFADVHGITAQRLYNLLCIAYGSDTKLFADLVEKGWLPKSRAETCADEYRQIEYASTTLFRQYTDEIVLKKVRSEETVETSGAELARLTLPVHANSIDCIRKE